MAILYADDPADAEAWAAAIRALAPSLELRFWPDWGPAAEIDFAIVGGKAPGDLRRFGNLSAIQSTWAGVNHLLADLEPAVRPAAGADGRPGPDRQHDRICGDARAGQRAARARGCAPRSARGNGWISTRSRQAVSRSRFWASARSAPMRGRGSPASASTCAAGAAAARRSPASRASPAAMEFKACLSGAHILICLLPLTDDTRGILNAAAFAPLAHGAILDPRGARRASGGSRSAVGAAVRPALARHPRRVRDRAAAVRSSVLEASPGDGDAACRRHHAAGHRGRRHRRELSPRNGGRAADQPGGSRQGVLEKASFVLTPAPPLYRHPGLRAGVHLAVARAVDRWIPAQGRDDGRSVRRVRSKGSPRAHRGLR